MSEGPRVNVSVIRDEAARKSLEREAELRLELAALRQPMRELQDKKDASIRSFQPKQEKFQANLDNEWETLQKEKNRLHGEMDKLKVIQHERQRMVDELRMLQLEIEPLRRDVVDLKTKVSECGRSITDLEDKRTKAYATLRFKSQTEADEAIERIEKEITAASKKGDSEKKLVAALVSERSKAEKAKREVVAAYSIDDKLLAAKRKEETLQSQLVEAQGKLEAKEETRTALRTKLDAEPRRGKSDEDDPYKILVAKVKAISQKLDDLRSKRKEAKPVNTELDGVNAELVAHKDRKTAIQKEIDELQRSRSSKTLRFDSELRSDIVGKGGANVEQLQQDFGVAIQVDGEGILTVIGGAADCDEAIEALKSIIEGIKKNRQTETVPFDMKLARAFIGTGGSNIQRVQTASGAEVKIKQEEGSIVLTGNLEAIAIAKALITDFVSNNASEELKFDPALRDVVIGKGGSTIRRIETESGVKRLNVDRDRSVITMSGNAEAVAKAKAAYTDLIEGMSNAFTMRVDDRMTRLVIGPQGKTINDIQDTTKALVECRNGTITIRGGKDAVAAARRMIEEITRREEIKIPYESYLYTVLTTRPLATFEDDEDGNRVQQEEKPTPLEEIKQLSACDQVSAIRGESKIVVRGKQQNVNQARTMIDELLRKLRPDVAKVPCPDIFINSFIKRGSSDRHNFLDRLKLKHTGLIHCDVDRKAHCVEIAGGKEAVSQAAAEVTQFVEDGKANLHTTTVHASAIGAILGSGGSNIAELTRKYGVEINIDRDTNVVTIWNPAGDKEKLDAAVAAVDALKNSRRRD